MFPQQPDTAQPVQIVRFEPDTETVHAVAVGAATPVAPPLSFSGALTQLRELVNAHLGLVAPGWALTDAFIAARLQRNPAQAITDPWVSERVTLGALQPHGGGRRLVAAAHLLRYGAGPAVGPAYAGTGEIAWFLAWPDAAPTAAALLAAAHTQMRTWGIARSSAWNTGLPVGPFVGTPDVWPHIAAALATAGYHAGSADEVVLGGRLSAVPPAGAPPLPGLSLERRVASGLWASHEMRFAALLNGREVGAGEVALDLTEGGALPALRRWAWLTDLQVEEPWRRQGIGAWLVAQMVVWARLVGRSRLLLATMADNVGAIRFYQRLGWERLVHEQTGWTRSVQP